MKKPIKIYTTSEACNILSRGRLTLYRWAERGLIIRIKDPSQSECLYAFPFDLDDAITPKEAAFMLGKSLTTVYTLLLQGKLHRIFQEGQTSYLSKRELTLYQKAKAEECRITSPLPNTEEFSQFAEKALRRAKALRKETDKSRANFQ